MPRKVCVACQYGLVWKNFLKFLFVMPRMGCWDCSWQSILFLFADSGTLKRSVYCGKRLEIIWSVLKFASTKNVQVRILWNAYFFWCRQTLRQVSRMIVMLKTTKQHKSCMQVEFFFPSKPQLSTKCRNVAINAKSLYRKTGFVVH